MKRQGGHDHLANSFTDLMTSLMIIFVLLFLTFIGKQSGASANVTDQLEKDLKKMMQGNVGFNTIEVKRDSTDPFMIVLIVPEQLLGFQKNDPALPPAGREFLKAFIPDFAGSLSAYEKDIDAIVIEGHASYTGTDEHNVELTQARAASVFRAAVDSLPDVQRAFFFDKVTVNGRGRRDCTVVGEDPSCRKVVFKVRVRAGQASQSAQTFQQGRKP
jgi:outer membrane protein OmpA-like peptidoglycan-associated protein